MKFSTLAQLLSIFVLSFVSQLFATTYIVGTCKAGHQFPTIGAALDNVTAPDTTVLICPGTYYEQVWIRTGVNLRGLTTDNTSQVYLYPPSIGLLGNDVDNDGNIIGAQIRATDATGPVNISNIVVDGNNANGGRLNVPYIVAGIYYRNSSGTINRVMVRNQGEFAQTAIGIWMEGGASDPSVTVENSSVHNFNLIAGIRSGQVATSTQSAPLTATIKGNFIDSQFPHEGVWNIHLASCDSCTNTVTGNTIYGGNVGVYMSSGAGSVTGNKLINNEFGLGVVGGSYKVTSNTIYDSFEGGIVIFVANSSSFEHNDIVSTPVGVDFRCHADGNVGSNVIEDVGIGLNKVPTGMTSTNTYTLVSQIKTGC